MPLFGFLRGIFRPKCPAEFSLGNRGRPGLPGAREDVVPGEQVERPPFPLGEIAKPASRFYRSLRKGTGRARHVEPRNLEPPHLSPFGGMTLQEREVLASNLTKSLDENLKIVMDIFHAPRNADLIVRKFDIRAKNGTKEAALVFMSGLVEETTIRRDLLGPLMKINLTKHKVNVSIEEACRRLVPELQVKTGRTFSEVVGAAVEGKTVLLIDGDTGALIVETRSVEHRSVEESPNEAVIRGPHAGFVENIRTNVSLVRQHIATPQLVSEYMYVGARAHDPIALVYIEGIVNPKLLEEVRRRILNVRADSAGTIPQLVHLIEDHPNNPFPTIQLTERPDKVASMILEGHVAVIGNSPAAMVLPSTLWGLMHSSEDHYIHFIPASFLRFIRWGALFATFYASAFYVAVVTYHPEMIPTQLLFAIASSREPIPFPTGIEVFFMEIALELIREAGIRIPTIIGPTIGIVGAVILGQAAVAANIVSPILVVVIAISGLGSFAIPNYDLVLVARILKFIMILVAAVLGIPGLTMATVVLVTNLFSLRSFGVPLTAPVLPWSRHNPDILIHGPWYRVETRPQNLRPLDAKSRTRIHRPETPVKVRSGGHGRDGDLT